MRARFTALALVALASGVHAQAPPTVDDWQISGTVGIDRVGLDLMVEDGQVASGHYFYASQLKDIALQPRTGEGPLTLAAADGSTFHLHFIGASAQAAPKGFADAVGLVGTWTQGARTLPVKLSLDGTSGSDKPGHRYALITSAPDAAVEAKARQFLQGVLGGDRNAAAGAIAYPLSVNGPGKQRLVIRDRADLLAHWDAIFTPKYLAILKTAVPHDMFVRDEGAMVAGGAAWFQERGASSLNLDVPG